MANCVTCKARCENAGQHRVKTDCISYIPKDYPKPMTNADRIRAMTDAELAGLACDCACSLCPITDCDGHMEVGLDKCRKKWLDWLKQEARE